MTCHCSILAPCAHAAMWSWQLSGTWLLPIRYRHLSLLLYVHFLRDPYPAGCSGPGYNNNTALWLAVCLPTQQHINKVVVVLLPTWSTLLTDLKIDLLRVHTPRTHIHTLLVLLQTGWPWQGAITHTHTSRHTYTHTRRAMLFVVLGTKV